MGALTSANLKLVEACHRTTPGKHPWDPCARPITTGLRRLGKARLTVQSQRVHGLPRCRPMHQDLLRPAVGPGNEMHTAALQPTPALSLSVIKIVHTNTHCGVRE